VSRWKPARGKKKDGASGSTGRLLGCVFIIGFALFLMYELFTAVLK